MDHPPMLEDEILLCGIFLLAGVIVGVISRFVFGRSRQLVQSTTEE